MKNILAAAAVACLAGLTACSVTTPAPDGISSSPATQVTSSAAPSQAPPSRPTATATAATDAEVKEGCELFNSLFAEYRASEPTSDAYEDLYSKAWKAKDAYTGNLRALFASLSALTISHSAVVEKGGQPDQVTKDALRDAVFANAGTCTAQGVTLTL